MGLMELPRTEPGQLIITPHPMLLDGQRNVVWEARADESLYALLMRNVPELDGQPWAVSIDGVGVDRDQWHCVRPKQGQIVEVRGGVGKSALMVVAMVALTYFTFGAGALITTPALWGAAGATFAINAGLYIAGSMLINKVLGPKPPKTSVEHRDSVYSLSGARNQLRQYEPIPLLFGRVRFAPDLLSHPYTWYQGNDQYLGLLLCAGVNVGRIEPLYNNDTLLSSYEGVRVFHSGYSQMPDETIPLYSNADMIDGAQLLDTSNDPKHAPSAWVERTSSADSVRLVVALEYQLYDKTSKGGDKNNTERVEIQYRPHGTDTWQVFGNYTINSSRTKAYRVGYAKDVAQGKYDVRVRTAGLNTNGSGAQAAFTWSTLTSVQADNGDYTGLSRTGIQLKATGQLNGSPDELRTIGYADPVPVWNGSAWSTLETSNPGAQILAYARGIRRGGRLLGGMALDEEQIDIEALKAFMLHCAANGYTYDNYIKEARSHDQVLSAIALAGFGQITWAGGRLGVVWAAQDQPLSGVVNMGTIRKGQFQVDYSLSNAADGIEYTYIDGETWETRTLRVPAPGVTTMLNPAQVTGEGVTTEEHAARMARWHLGQSLYQYKDISYSTDIEHLSYQRMSVLAMQHDMTQWGHGGRVSAAVNEAGKVTLTLDEAVPAPASGNAYIGLRLPGERVYRVLRVAAFSGESRQLTLADAWPADAALPGGSAENPAHDTLWIYDFKQTPGLRVRVVSVEPESDLKGASVHVVAEGPEFWQYVLTGHYVPSPKASLLQTRPVASGLKITEQQVVQGNTTFTELTATFDVSGPVGNIVVRAAANGQELEEVAQTQTRTATWRVPAAGVYNIVVRPFSPEGEAGVAASVTYTTSGADVPPVLVDLFDVEQRSGGVRLYTWGWLSDTIQSPDFAGVEIRYVAGTVASPDWDAMTPVGETGYHTAPFEAVVPQAGQWTFACRSRNASGQLSSTQRVISRNLGANLGEQIGGIGEDIGELTRVQLELQQQQDRDRHDRLQGDLQAAVEAAADATNKANAARDAAKAYADGLLGSVGDLVAADEWQAETTYPKGDFVAHAGKLYRSRVDANVAQQPDTNPLAWEKLGEYASAGEAIAASLSMATQNASDIAAEASRIDAVVARLPGEDNGIATTAQVAGEAQARVDGDGALGQRLDVVQASVAGKADATAVQSLKGQVDTIDGKVTSQGEAITSVQSATNAVANARPNILPDPTFAINGIWASNWAGAWALTGQDRESAGPMQWWNNVPKDGRTVFCDSPHYMRVYEGQSVTASVESRAGGVRTAFYVELLFYSAESDTAFIASRSGPVRYGPFNYSPNAAFDARKMTAVAAIAPAGAAFCRMRVVWVMDGSGVADQISFARPKVELGDGATPYNDQMSAVMNANALLALTTRAAELEAQSAATMGVVASLGKTGSNMLLNPTFASGAASWVAGSVQYNWEPRWGNYVTFQATPGGAAIAQYVDVAGAGRDYTLAADVYRNSVAGIMRVELTGYDANGAQTATKSVATDATTSSSWQRPSVTVNMPSNTVRMLARLIVENTDMVASWRRAKLEAGSASTPYSDERTLTQNAQAVQALEARVTPLEVSAAATTAVLAKMGGGGNLLENASFDNGAAGFYWLWQTVPATLYKNNAGPEWRPYGVNCLGAASWGVLPGSPGQLHYLDLGIEGTDRSFVAVKPGSEYIMSGYMGLHRGAAFAMYMIFLDRNGNSVGEFGLGDVPTGDTPNSNPTIADLRRIHVKGKAPPGASRARLGWRWIMRAGQESPHIWLFMPMFEEVPSTQTEPSAWTPGANAVQTASAITQHTADINAVSGRVAAKITNVTDVNGRISGTISENDGVRSYFGILSDVFELVASGSVGMEIRRRGVGWYMRFYAASIQLILGIKFGAQNNLCGWYGPNIGEAAASTANGTIWANDAGSAYFGGSLSAGTLKNAVQTTTTVTVGTSLINGPFSTLGRTRNVTLSFSRAMHRVRTAYGNDGFVAGAGSNTATIQLWRKIGNGAETLWQTLSAGGDISIINDYDGPDTASSYWTGAATYSDVSPGAETVTYRAVITGFTQQDVTHQSGGYNGQTIEQNLSIISVEQ